MSTGGIISQAVAKRWVEQTLASYRTPLMVHAAGDEDPFRNPVAHTVRQNLTTLTQQLLGAMDQTAVASALDAIVRLRAVQDFSAAEAVGFVFDLRSLVREASSPIAASLDQRIDQLALMAFDIYMNCRQQIFELRAREIRLQAQRDDN